jgi:hypothetical protein
LIWINKPYWRSLKVIAGLADLTAAKLWPREERSMKLAPKIFAASLLAGTSFCFAGAAHAVPLGMGLSLNEAVPSDIVTVRGGGGRGGGGGARVGGGGGARVGGIGGAGRPGGIGGVGGPGRPGGIGGVGGVGGPGRPGNIAGGGWNGGNWNGGNWNGGYWRPGYGLAAGAVAGAALGSYYGGGYGYDSGYYGGDYGYGSAYGSGYGADASAYCAQRFKSYDPASGTYLGYDGARHPCP